MTFEEAIAKIPLTWTCIDCGREFDNLPDEGSERPYGCRAAFDKNGREYVEGEICERCFVKNEPSN